jgi:hypothetical protein
VAIALAASPRGSRANPVPMHEGAVIPESKGWRVKVNRSIPNATSMVLAENQFNDKPASGRQFFVINVTATYKGGGRSSVLEALTLSALGKSNVAYDTSDNCGVVPDELDTFKKVFSGGSLVGNVCFSVKKRDVASVLLMVEPSFSFNDVLIFFKTRRAAVETTTKPGPKLYPVEQSVIRSGCKGAYNNVEGARGPIHYAFTKTQGECWFQVRSKGFEFKGTVVFTRPQRCTYRMVITVEHQGKVQYRDVDTTRVC